MGNKSSLSKYVGYSDTPEHACKSLEYELQKKYPHAFVTISVPEEVKVIALSPRSVPYLALANIGDGKNYEVKFEKDANGVIAKIK